MSLKLLLNPKSIAVVGASNDRNSVGNGILVSLLKGGVFHSKYAKPFKGKIFAVNPHHDKIMGLKSYGSVTQVKGEVDLAVIAVPARIVPQVLKECASKKIHAAIVVSAGFGETGNKELEEEVKEICLQNDISLVGPNTIGIMVPGLFNASFAPSVPKPGNVAFISQSGALADSVIDWALEEFFPFSAIVGLGNKAVLDESHFVKYFADDPQTKVITLYLEGVKDLLHAAVQGIVVEAIQPAEILDVLPGVHPVVQAGIVGQKANAFADFRGFIDDVKAGDGRGARSGFQHGAEDTQRRGFAGPVGSEQAEDLAGTAFEANVVQCRNRAVLQIRECLV